MDKYLSVITNFGCHFSCPYCIVKNNNLDIPKTTLKGLDKLQEEILNNKCNWVSLSGGGNPLRICAHSSLMFSDNATAKKAFKILKGYKKTTYPLYKEKDRFHNVTCVGETVYLNNALVERISYSSLFEDWIYYIKNLQNDITIAVMQAELYLPSELRPHSLFDKIEDALNVSSKLHETSSSPVISHYSMLGELSNRPVMKGARNNSNTAIKRSFFEPKYQTADLKRSNLRPITK